MKPAWGWVEGVRKAPGREQKKGEGRKGERLPGSGGDRHRASFSTLLQGGGRTGHRKLKLEILVSNALKGEVAVDVTRAGICARTADPPQAHGTQLALEQRRGEQVRGAQDWRLPTHENPVQAFWELTESLTMDSLLASGDSWGRGRSG